MGCASVSSQVQIGREEATHQPDLDCDLADLVLCLGGLLVAGCLGRWRVCQAGRAKQELQAARLWLTAPACMHEEQA